MTRYLLDTNVVSHLMREPAGVVAEKIRAVGEANVFTSILVSAEVRYGIAKRGSAKLAQRYDAIMKGLAIHPFEHPADAVYGTLRSRLELEGKPIGALDMLIAAQAIATDSVLVTDNVQEFGRVAGLRIENWVRRLPE